MVILYFLSNHLRATMILHLMSMETLFINHLSDKKMYFKVLYFKVQHFKNVFRSVVYLVSLQNKQR